MDAADGSGPRVKVCGITTERDVDLAVELGADAIGLNFYPPSPRALEPRSAARLARRCPPFTTVVALFVNPRREDVSAVLDTVAGIAVLQFHGTEEPEFCAGFGRPYVKAVAMEAGVDLAAQMRRFATAGAMLLDAFDPDLWGGTGRSFDWKRVPGERAMPIVLAGGLTADNVADAIRRVRPYAVDVCGGVESAPGRKDERKLRAFMRSVHSVRSS